MPWVIGGTLGWGVLLGTWKFWVTYLPYSSSVVMEHRSSTRARHLTLFCAVHFASFLARCFLSNSAILVRRQVCWGLPLFRFPVGSTPVSSSLHVHPVCSTCGRSSPLSAPRNTRTSWSELLHLLLKARWSIWFTITPSGDFHVRL